MQLIQNILRVFGPLWQKLFHYMSFTSVPQGNVTSLPEKSAWDLAVLRLGSGASVAMRIAASIILLLVAFSSYAEAQVPTGDRQQLDYPHNDPPGTLEPGFDPAVTSSATNESIEGYNWFPDVTRRIVTTTFPTTLDTGRYIQGSFTTTSNIQDRVLSKILIRDCAPSAGDDAWSLTTRISDDNFGSFTTLVSGAPQTQTTVGAERREYVTNYPLQPNTTYVVRSYLTQLSSNGADYACWDDFQLSGCLG